MKYIYIYTKNIYNKQNSMKNISKIFIGELYYIFYSLSTIFLSIKVRIGRGDRALGRQGGEGGGEGRQGPRAAPESHGC